MYIAVCEDQKDLANSLRRDIESYFENRGEPLVAIRDYYDGQALLDADAVQPFDIIFMDIELPGISGMEAAKALRQRGSDALIVFVTAYSEFMATSFHVEAFDFLTKPVQPSDIARVLNRCVQKLNRQSGTIVVKIGTGAAAVRVRDILYISSSKHYLAVVYSLLQQGETEKAMQELENRQVEIAQNHVFDTGYPLLNSVLAYKLQWAKEQHIQTKIFWNLTEPLAINQTDLAVILANGLDNAIEAAGQVVDEQAYITVSAENKLHYLVLKISNNSAVPPLEKDGKLVTTKKEKHLHGFGLESIHHLALQYEGESSFAYQDGEFVLTVMLKNKAETEQEGTELAI